MLSTRELELVVRALRSHRRECCIAIDNFKQLLGKEDPAYSKMTDEYYRDIEEAADLIDKLKGIK